MQETEHKAVAFDVFNLVTKQWTAARRFRFRARVMVFVSVHFAVNITRYAAALLGVDGMGRWTARWRVLRFLFGSPGLFRRLGPRYRDWFRPTFHPWDHDNRAKLADWRREFDSRALSI